MNRLRLTKERLAELRAHPWPMVPVEEFRALLDAADECEKLRARVADLEIELEIASQIPVDETADGNVRGFAAYILHGDEEHRAWLLAAAEAFIADEPLPPRR